MKNAAKIISIVAFILWILAMWKSSSIFESKQVPIQVGGNQEEETTNANKKGDTNVTPSPFLAGEALLKSPFPISKYQPLIEKNIFVKPEPPPEVFDPSKLNIVSISPLILPFMYKGFIQLSDGTVVGQVNWSGKTYFVKKGEKLKDYKVMSVNNKIIKVESKDGQVIGMEYKKPVKGNEFAAKLHNIMNNKEYEVKKNDEVLGYKILDIRADTVVLYGQDKEWVINKGR